MLLAKGTTAASLSSALQLKVVLSWILSRPDHLAPEALTVRGRSAAMAQEKKIVWCIVESFMLSRVGIVWQNKCLLEENGNRLQVAEGGIGDINEVKRKIYWCNPFRRT